MKKRSESFMKVTDEWLHASRASLKKGPIVEVFKIYGKDCKYVGEQLLAGDSGLAEDYWRVE